MMKKGILYKIRRKMQVAFFNVFSIEFVSKTYYKIVLKKKLNLDEPKTLNEKIQWLKIYHWPKNDLVIKCADKFAVREYVDSVGFSNVLNELYFVCDDPSKIDYDALPNQFVIKCTHGCSYNIICKDKSKLDIKNTNKQLRKWLKEDFGKFNAEIHYSKIKPQIIVEKYLGEHLDEYKFFCFNGSAKLMYINGDSNTTNEKKAYFDKDGVQLNMSNDDYPVYENAAIPSCFSLLRDMSETLAKPFPFVRVDWYLNKNDIIFGELTFTPEGGLNKFSPKEWDNKLGDLLNISELVNNEKNGKRKH